MKRLRVGILRKRNQIGWKSWGRSLRGLVLFNGVGQVRSRSVALEPWTAAVMAEQRLAVINGHLSSNSGKFIFTKKRSEPQSILWIVSPSFRLFVFAKRDAVRCCCSTSAPVRHGRRQGCRRNNTRPARFQSFKNVLLRVVECGQPWRPNMFLTDLRLYVAQVLRMERRRSLRCPALCPATARSCWPGTAGVTRTQDSSSKGSVLLFHSACSRSSCPAIPSRAWSVWESLGLL